MSSIRRRALSARGTCPLKMLSGAFGIVVLAIKTTQIEFVSKTLANDYSLQQWHLGMISVCAGFGVRAQRCMRSVLLSAQCESDGMQT